MVKLNEPAGPGVQDQVGSRLGPEKRSVKAASVGVGLGVFVDRGVFVGLRVGDGVLVNVDVAVGVGVLVSVGDGLNVGVAEAVGEGVSVAAAVGLLTVVGVDAGTEEMVTEAVELNVNPESRALNVPVVAGGGASTRYVNPRDPDPLEKT